MPINYIETYLFVALGILVSIVLPILRKALPPGTRKATGVRQFSYELYHEFFQQAQPYLVVLAFSLLTAVVVIAFTGDILNAPPAAFIAGYAWDSTIQKIKGVE
jgi:hypothetical protein